jgi:hypothetical protein
VIYRLGRKLNLARFFAVIGVLLMVFAAGLLADTVQNLQRRPHAAAVADLRQLPGRRDHRLSRRVFPCPDPPRCADPLTFGFRRQRSRVP